MNYSYYKYCMVPQCKSTSIKTPNKLFIYVPNNKQIREKWLKIARRVDAQSLSTHSRKYFCEDHFDLPNDMVNYTEYHIMGKVSQVRMKSKCIPKKFECQEDRRKRTCNDTIRPYILKKQRIKAISECLYAQEERSVLSESHKHTFTSSLDNLTIGKNVPENLCKKEADKSVEALITPKLKRTNMQTKMKSIDQALLPLKPTQKPSTTSPIKIRTIIKSNPSVYSLSNITRNILIKEEHSDCNMLYFITYYKKN